MHGDITLHGARVESGHTQCGVDRVGVVHALHQAHRRNEKGTRHAPPCDLGFQVVGKRRVAVAKVDRRPVVFDVIVLG